MPHSSIDRSFSTFQDKKRLTESELSYDINNNNPIQDESKSEEVQKLQE